MTDRQLIELARTILTSEEFDVWVTKLICGYGRERGSLELGITESEWRTRLNRATRKITAALKEAA